MFPALRDPALRDGILDIQLFIPVPCPILTPASRQLKLGHWIFPALRDPALRDGILDIELGFILTSVSRLLKLGYWIFPALRDPALRDGILDIEFPGCSALNLDIGYSVLDIGY